MKNIIKTIKLSLVVLGLVAGFAFAAATPAMAAPDDVLEDSCTQAGNAGSDFCQGRDQQDLFGAGGIFTNIVNVIIYVIGAVAVIMVVIGGFKYVISGGDAAQVTSAKNTIMYSIVGVVIAIMSYAIVNFVITAF